MRPRDYRLTEFYRLYRKKVDANKLAVKHIKFDGSEKCEDCGTTEKLVRHHFDYNKPIEIMILCASCHWHWHQKNKAII